MYSCGRFSKVFLFSQFFVACNYHWAATTFVNFQRRCTTFVKLAQSDEQLFRWLFTDFVAFLPGSDVFLLGSDEFRLDLVFHVVSLTKVFLLKKCNPVQNILRKIKKSSKVRQKKKNDKKWYLFLRTVWALVPKMYFCRGDWAKDWVPMNFFNFPDISLLCKILSFKSFGNRWAKWCIQFVLVDMTFRFTCRE